MSTFDRMLRVLRVSAERHFTWESILSRDAGVVTSEGKRRKRQRRSPVSARTPLGGETLESRTLLAITTFSGGPVSNYLIVASSPDTPGAAADDVFITSTAAQDRQEFRQELLIANNSSFAPLVLGGSADGNHEVPDTLYVTNGAAGQVQSLLSPGDNRSIDNGGQGYQQDGMLSRTTTHVLKHGAVNPPWYRRNDNGLLPFTYQGYDNDQGVFDFLVENRVMGRVAYDNPVSALRNAWDFEIAPNGRGYLRQVSGDSTGPRPIAVTLQPGDQYFTGQGRGYRGSVSIGWSAPVATVPHQIAGEITSPVLERISYTADSDLARAQQTPDYVLEELNIAASATSTPEFQFDVGGAGTIIEGTLRGTINIATVQSQGGLVPGLSIDFRTDLLAGNALYFVGPRDGVGPQSLYQTVGYVDWLRVSGTYQGNGQIKLRFENRFDGNAGRTHATAVGFTRPQPVQPGPVTITGLTFAEYVTPEKASDFTLFAGYDLDSQIWVDLRAPGSDINIDSPVIVSRRPDVPNVPDVDLRATNVTIDARVSSGNDLFVGASRSGTVTETLLVNASVRVPREARIYVEDDPRTTPTATGDLLGPDRGKLLVSQTGSIAATFYTTAPQFGNSGVQTIATESEPNDDGLVGASAADLARANDLSGSFVPLGDNNYQATITGTISVGNDREWDFFKVPLRANDVMEISLVSAGLGDPYVRLYTLAAGSAGAPATVAQIAANDDGGAGLNSYLSYVNGNSDGEFFIAADSFGSSSGRYVLTVTVRGSNASFTETILVTAVKADVLVEGAVFGDDQSYLMRSGAVDAALNAAPYFLTTKSQRTGRNSGVIRGDVVQAILANDAATPLDLSIAYNAVDLNTAVNSLRVRASVRQNGVDTSPSGPFPYRLTIREENAVSIDAVAASTLPISVVSDGAITWTSALNTAGDIGITTRNVGNTLNSFVCSAPITTTHGTISIVASDIVVGSSLIVSDAAPRSPDRTDIVLDAANGNVTLTGLVQSPNRIRIGQSTPGLKAGRVAGAGKVKTLDLFINAVTIGNPEADPSSTQFYLRTEVDSLQVDAQNGVAIDESDDITVTQLRSPAGLVALRAAGADNRAGSPNAIALTASLRDVVNLFVSAPDGSIEVRNDSAERLVLGIHPALERGTAESMKAGGNVSIISTAGGIDILDAPFGGSGASTVAAFTTSFLPGTYDKGIPGQRASTISGGSAIASLSAVGQPFEKTARPLRVNDRVLVSRGAGVSKAAVGILNANGIYVVTSVGGSGKNWVLTRVADADTYEEFPSSKIVYASATDQYFVCTHAMSSPADFGALPVTVTDFKPSTQIGVSVVVPKNDIRYIVSSTGGTNIAAGSFGKMLTIAQVNQPADSDQREGFAFSSTLPGTIVLVQQLPEIKKPLQIDGNARWPAETAGDVLSIPVVFNGQFITTSSRGGELYRGTVSATVRRAEPLKLLVPTTFMGVSFLQAGMPATGIGISSGSRIVSVTENSASGNTEVVLDRAVSASFKEDGTGSVSVTFATALDGLRFAVGSDNAAVGNIFIGGFENGAAIAVTSQNVSITRVGVGIDSNGNRLSNTNGILVTGSASVTGGTVVSSTAAGVQTGSLGKLEIVGTEIGREKLPNVEGVRIAGTGGFKLGKTNAAGTPVQFNRVGVVIENGKNEIVNATIANNAFEGIIIEGGESRIGPAAAGSVITGRNAIFANGGWGIVVSGRPAGKNATDIVNLAGRQEIRNNLFLSPKDAPGTIPASNRRGALGLASQGAGNAGYTISDYATTNPLHRVANGVDQKGNRYVAIPDAAGPVLLVAAAVGLNNNNLLEADSRTVKGANSNFVKTFVLTLNDEASGVDASSIAAEAFKVSVANESQTPRLLVAGVHYQFDFAGVESGEVRFTTLSGSGYFPQGQYTITATGRAKSGPDAGRLVDNAGNVIQGDPDALSAGIATRTFVLADVPGQPTEVKAVAKGTGIQLTWEPPGISIIPVTNYIIQIKQSGEQSWTNVERAESTDRSIDVPDLQLGVGYSFRVAAVNPAGEGEFSSPTAEVVPRGFATAPRDLLAAAGDRSVTLTWSVPASNGGNVITSYVVEQSGDAGKTWTLINSPVMTTMLTIDGLVNGRSYIFRVSAQTDAGRGVSSQPSTTVIPFGPASAPRDVIAVGGNGQAMLSWTAPSSDGGRAATDYLLQASVDEGRTWTTVVDTVSTATAATVTGLTNGISYMFRVAAQTAAGPGAWSAASTAIPRSVASSPQSLVVTAGDGRAMLTWLAPLSTSGSPVTDYVIQSSVDNGRNWNTVVDGSSAVTNAAVLGLTNGTTYVFRVAALTAAGTGAWTAASTGVTPRGPATAPQDVQATVADGRVVVTWNAPTSLGGSVLRDYVVQSSTNGGVSWSNVADGVSTATTATVTGLVNGTAYVFRVAAITDHATGSFSAATAAVVPLDAPGAITGLQVQTGTRQMVLSWRAPTNNGGRPVTDYRIEYRTGGSASWVPYSRAASSATTATITGLAANAGYVFRLRAVTDFASGQAVETTEPSVMILSPTRVTGRAANGSVALTWLPPKVPATMRVIDYRVQYSIDGVTWITVADGVSAASRTTIRGLTNGTSYFFRVAAVTARGVGGYSASSARLTPVGPRRR